MSKIPCHLQSLDKKNTNPRLLLLCFISYFFIDIITTTNKIIQLLAFFKEYKWKYFNSIWDHSHTTFITINILF